MEGAAGKGAYEAMAAGLPIITTDRGGNAEVIRQGENGFVVKDFNRPEAIAERIRYLLDNKHIAKKLGMSGRKIVETEYNWERVANQLLDFSTAYSPPSGPGRPGTVFINTP